MGMEEATGDQKSTLNNGSDEELGVGLIEPDSEFSEIEITFSMKINRFLHWLIESESVDKFLTALVIVSMIIAVLYLISNTLVDKVEKFIDGIHNLTLQEEIPTHFSSNDISRNHVKS